MTVDVVLKLAAVRKGFAAPEGGRVEVLDFEHFELGRGEQVELRGVLAERLSLNVGHDFELVGADGQGR